MLSRAVSVVGVCLAAACAVEQPSPDPPVAAAPLDGAGDGTLVRTRKGLVRGVVEGSMRVWRGIPFAAPPVGDLRWRPPRAPARWHGVRDASTYAPVCLQRDGAGGYVGDEDCLYVNVYAPSPAHRGSKLPVAFWIHGGSRRRGDSRLSPEAFVGHGVVVVSIAYRLDRLGFLGHAGFTDESGTSGNWGFLDMVAALGWTRRNVRRFGGDPDRIMIVGQSSGGSAVNALLASPLARGRFRTAVIQSNSLEPGESRSLAESETTGVEVAAQLGCAGTDAEQVACLRAQPATDVQGAFASVPPLLYAIVDGRFLLEDVAATLDREGAGVPLILGSTREEESLSFLDVGPITADELSAQVHADFPAVADDLLPLYPLSDYTSPLWALIAVESDGLDTCGVRRLALAMSLARHPRPVYRYLFAHAAEADPLVGQYRAFHGIDVPFVFGDLETVGVFTGVPDYAPTAAERELADQIEGYWARFAATGDPNGDGAVFWPRYKAATEKTLQLDDAIAVVAGGYHADACDLLVPL